MLPQLKNINTILASSIAHCAHACEQNPRLLYSNRSWLLALNLPLKHNFRGIGRISGLASSPAR
jgi:hypothetical protein